MELNPDNQDSNPIHPLNHNQVRERLKAAVAFRHTESYEDFIANLDAAISGADSKIEFPPESFFEEKAREQAIGERRQARVVKDFFPDYIEEMHKLLNSLLAEQELEPEDHRNPNPNPNKDNEH